MTKQHPAWHRGYVVGYTDGLAWDLDGFDSRERVEATGGWADATIDAVGIVVFAAVCGVTAHDAEDRAAAWDAAVAGYDAGAHDGACADQTARSGAPAPE